MSDMAKDGKILRTVVFAQTGFIFAEGNVEYPMTGIFNLPMGTSGLQQISSRGLKGRDKIASFQ